MNKWISRASWIIGLFLFLVLIVYSKMQTQLADENAGEATFQKEQRIKEAEEANQIIAQNQQKIDSLLQELYACQDR